MFRKKKEVISDTEVNIFNFDLIKAGADTTDASLARNVDVGFIPRVNDGIVIEGEAFQVVSVAYDSAKASIPAILVSYAGNNK